MTVSFAGLVGTIGLPAPWGLVTSGGIIVHTHGTVTGQDTTNYTVSFAPLVPGTGSVTAYLVATAVQIQQNPFPLVGAPQGHPSFNPNFIPSTAYATNTYSVSLAAVTGQPNNTTTFELLRTTLTAGQNSITTVSDIGWQRAPSYNALPANPFAAGGIMTLAQAQAVATPLVANLSQTLPAVATAGGLSYKMVNPLSVGNWTIVAQSADRITGATGTPAASLVIPPGGAMQVWGNAASGQWDITEVNPLMLASLANVFTAPQTINAAGAVTALTLSGGTTQGTNIALFGNGATTPNKYLRSFNGSFGIVNSAYTSQILSLDDGGDLSITGQVYGASLYTTGTLGVVGATTIAGTLTVGAATQLNSNLNVLGGINAGATGIGTTGPVVAGAGGFSSASGPVSVGGQIVAAGPITSSAGNILAGLRLRAVYGALNSGDINAAAILADFPVLFGNNGYQYLPSGFIFQWMIIIAPPNNVRTYFPFPVAFPHGCMAVMASYEASLPPLQGAIGADLYAAAGCMVANSAQGGGIGNGSNVWALGW